MGPSFFLSSLRPKRARRERSVGRRDVRRPPPYVEIATSIDAVAYTRERAK
jgi:hypothetical protein